MKDLKKKYEDIRQAEIDAQPKKREIVAEAPKAPVEEGWSS